MTEDQLTRAIADHDAGRLEAAEEGYRSVLAEDPDNADALHMLGALHLNTGDAAGAEELIVRAIEIRPDDTRFHNSHGIVLRTLERYEDARTAFERSLAAAPDNPEAYANLGALLLDRKRYEEAAFTLRKAMIYQPDHITACNNLGRALLWLDQAEEAIGLFQAVLHMQPDHVMALTNLGVGLNMAGDHEAAREAFERAIEIDPAQIEAHINLGQTLLLLGDFENGWAEQEWRLRRADYRTEFAGPRWQSEDVAGKTVMLWTEQGLGDAIHFARYAPMVAAKGARVVVECEPALHRLFRGVEGVAEVAETEAVHDYDFHAPLMSLPLIFKTDAQSIPAEVPYLARPAPMGMDSRNAPGDGPRVGPRVGLVWSGNPEHSRDIVRSRRLSEFAPLARVAGAAFFSLQLGAAGDETPPDGMELVDLVARNADFRDTAAAMLALDLVISVDTAPAHLAGALGVPVWVLLPATPDWRWLLGRDDCPWYPSMRLFREDGDWPATFERVAEALAGFSG